MSCQEQQEEEVEVLQSIYEGDANFKQVNNTTYQYKYGEEDGFQTFLLELQWGDNYPEEAPVINLDVFYNKHVVDSVKDAIRTGFEEQIGDLLGMPMTFTLFEWVKDNLDNLLKTQPNASASQTISDPAGTAGGGGDDKSGGKKEKKEALSKQQKRRIYDKFGTMMDDRPRGWNWVDVVKHLSQTGGKSSDTG